MCILWRLVQDWPLGGTNWRGSWRGRGGGVSRERERERENVGIRGCREVGR